MRELIYLFLIGLFFTAELFAQSRFDHAKPGYAWQFPRDHGSHSNYETEWWYYTGQLWGMGEEPFRAPARYGFQLTFFRRGEVTQHKDPLWDNSFLAHAALTTIYGTQKFVHAERRARGGISIAGAAPAGLDLWNHLWSARESAGMHELDFSVQEESNVTQLHLGLDARSIAPLLNGEGGFSRKGPSPEHASLYYSMPAIPLTGRISSSKGSEDVHGLAWMDHEFMTDALSPEQQGWDWVGLIGEKNEQIMLFRVRGKGSSAPFLSGTVRTPQATKILSAVDFSMTEVDFWTSLKTRARYPIAWKIEIPSLNFSTQIRARLNEQEIVAPPDAVAPTYWEGAVASEAGSNVIGYLEMTGYAGREKP